MSEVFFLSENHKKKCDKKVYITGIIINSLVWAMAFVLIAHTTIEVMHHLTMAKIIDVKLFKPPHIREVLIEQKLQKDLEKTIETPNIPPPSVMKMMMPPLPLPPHHHNAEVMKKIMPWRILLLVCHLGVGLNVLYLLKKLTKGYQKKDFFSLVMVKRYAFLGISLLVLALISLGQSLLMFSIFDFSKIDFSEQLFIMIFDLWFKPYGILAITGLHCLVLAVVMREGNRIFEEQSLTI